MKMNQSIQNISTFGVKKLNRRLKSIFKLGKKQLKEPNWNRKIRLEKLFINGMYFFFKVKQ